MARPKRMGGRIAFYIPPGVAEQVEEVVRLRTERQAGLPAWAADVYREAVVRGLPLVLAAERGVPWRLLVRRRVRQPGSVRSQHRIPRPGEVSWTNTKDFIPSGREDRLDDSAPTGPDGHGRPAGTIRRRRDGDCVLV